MFDGEVVWVWAGGLKHDAAGKSIPFPSLPRRGDGLRRVWVKTHEVVKGRGKRARRSTRYKLYDVKERGLGYPDVLDEDDFALVFCGFSYA
jgi:hypothetical protein